MNIDEFTSSFNELVAAAQSPGEKPGIIAGSLGPAFGVNCDEIAIFSLDDSREMLVFIWPQSLRSVGSIPLNAHRCLVAKTAVEKKGELDNNFASTPHLYMFEHFLAVKGARVPIQKIMSVPVMSGNNLKGVVQIARKGSDRDSAGADFTTDDLDSLSAVATLIAGHL